MTRADLFTVAAIIAVALIMRECGRREGRAEQVMADSVAAVDAHVDSTDRWKAAFASREIQRESVITRQGQQLASAEATVKRLTERIRPVVDTLASPEMLGAIALRDSVIGFQRMVIAHQHAQLGIYRAMILERDTLIGRYEIERTAYKNLYIAMQRQARPGIVEQARRAIPFALAAVVVWEAVR